MKKAEKTVFNCNKNRFFLENQPFNIINVLFTIKLSFFKSDFLRRKVISFRFIPCRCACCMGRIRIKAKIAYKINTWHDCVHVVCC